MGALRSERGGIGIHTLGAALMLLLLVGGLGLAEATRASAVRAVAVRSLAAALQSAARHPEPSARQRVFAETLKANLGNLPHRAELRALPAGARHPLTGRYLNRPALHGRLEMDYRLAYLGRWLPAVPLEVAQTLPVRTGTTARPPRAGPGPAPSR